MCGSVPDVPQDCGQAKACATQGNTETIRSAAHARFHEPAESFVVGPPGCPIERKRQTILWQVDRGGHEVIDRCEASLTEHVVIDDAKILQVGIAIA